MFTVGDTVGDYEIVARLRSGGMATLFLGRRAGASGFAKHVAIKVVHEHLATDPTFAQMFVEEALLCARIQHPNVVHVEELRENAGRHFLVMEYVYGGSLAQLLQALQMRRRRLAADLAVHIAIKLADGLHAAHEATDEQGVPLGVVHRDMTPQNVLLSYKGAVKLIDFGVAKARGRSRETETGSIKGKFRYLAPEQAFARGVDRRTDIYALGIVLWEMLTMRQRFEGRSDGAILNRVRYPEAIPPSKHAPTVSPELDAVVLKALSPDPADRYQTAHALRDALVDVLPRAASLHESVLGQLVSLVLGDELAEEEKALPESVSRLLRAAPSGTPAEEVLGTLTSSLSDHDVADIAADEGTDPGPLQEAATQLFDVSEELSAPSIDDERPTDPPPAPDPVLVPRRAPASNAPPLAFVAALAAVVVVFGLVIGLLLVLVLAPDEPPVGPVTVLPTDVAPPFALRADAGLAEAIDAGPPAPSTAEGVQDNATDVAPIATPVEGAAIDAPAPRGGGAVREPASGRSRGRSVPRRRGRPMIMEF